MEKPKHKLLIVDDDTELCHLLSEYLEGVGFSVSAVHDGEASIELLKSGASFDAIVLDIMMPKISGLDVLQSVREFSDVPIPMLTGRGDDIDRIVGLEPHADDYLGKPCNPRELAARLNAIFRRTQPDSNPSHQNKSRIAHLDLELNPATMDVYFQDNKLNFTGAEFRVLINLVQHQGQTLSKETLTQEVLNRPLTAYDRSIDVHVSRIRQKISQAGSQVIIKSIRGVGYQLASRDS